MPDPLFKFGQGDVVKDGITGYKGVVIARTEWKNGCKRYTIQSQELDKGKPIEAISVDEQDLMLIKAAKKEKEETTKPGGPPARGSDPKR